MRWNNRGSRISPSEGVGMHDRNIEPMGGGRRAPWLDRESIAAVEAAEALPFTPDEYARRLSEVRARLSAIGADAILVFRPSSVEYLCGYHSAETAPQPLLVTHDAEVLYVLDLEIGRALASSQAGTILYCGYDTMPRALELIAEHAARQVPRGGRLAVETGHTSTPPRVLELLDAAGVVVTDGEFLVEETRLVLSDAEVRCVEQAAAATQRGVEAAVEAASRPDATDASVGAAITEALLRDANSRSAWGPVVATGERGGIAHSTWLGRPLSDGPTFVEFAGTHHRYHAPVMRTLCRGVPSAAAKRLERLSQDALAAVLGTARAGVTAREVAQQALRAIEPLPDDVVFHRMFGYPVGLAHPPHWMDGPPFYLTTGNEQPLREGMVFHVPASFRSFGKMGVGLSHTFLVERHGTRPLTHGTAELITL
jgi:Xaa-Pro dipeptidase